MSNTKGKRSEKILFICPSSSTFILKDLQILQANFDVKVLKWDVTHVGINKFLDIIKLLLEIIKSDLCFSWFVLDYATYSVFLSKIFRKKSIIVVGGFDVVNMPEIEYGAMRSQKHRNRAIYAMTNANKLLAVSDYTKNEAIKCVGNIDIKILYHGFDFDLYLPKGLKDNIVITVGAVTSQNLKRKGLEMFVKSAKYLPDIKFILIGKHIDNSIDYLKSIASPNVEFIGFVAAEELIKYIQKAKVYVQVSAHEGFGCSLAEAMLCECVPVVTNRGAIPEVVGEMGFYAKYNDPKDTALKIQDALNSNFGRKARERTPQP